MTFLSAFDDLLFPPLRVARDPAAGADQGHTHQARQEIHKKKIIILTITEIIMGGRGGTKKEAGRDSGTGMASF